MNNTNVNENVFSTKNDKVQLYANKLDKIAESFGIVESTVSEIGKEFDNLQLSISSNTSNNTADNIVKGVISTNNNSTDSITHTSDVHENLNDKNMDLLLKYEIIAEDFKMVRTNLRNLIDNSNLLIQNLQTTLIMEGDINPDSINSFVNVGNLINNSMKMLLSNYNELLTIESKIKIRTSPPTQPNHNPMLPSIGGGNNIIIATNTADLIASKLADSVSSQNKQN